MMKKRLSKLVVVCTVLAMVLGTTFASAATKAEVTSLDGAKAKVQVDWNHRYTYEELGTQLKNLNKTYGKYSKLEIIGKTHEDRPLYCMTITDESVAKSKKTEVTVFGNIHGGERESGSCAMYSAWYLLENSGRADVAKLLKNYVVYVIPVINPDGYTQSFTWNTRQNMKPTDHDGDGTPFSDTYADIDGDGYIASISAATDANTKTGSAGYESKDSNGNGILADDVKASKIDMNRTFDYMWGEDGEMDTEGEAAATEPEIQAVQKFIAAHPKMTCLATLHTGIQCVLYPWGFRKAHKDMDDMSDFNYMDQTSKAMAKTIAAGTQRNFYYKQSYFDYPTYSELIDYAYGKFGIHAYTIEVYSAGKTDNSTYNPDRDFGSDADCTWNNTLPEVKKVYYDHAKAAELLKAAGVDPAKLQIKGADGKYRLWSANEGLLFTTSATAQMVDKVPEQQDVMVSGVMKGLMEMFTSEKAVNTMKLSVKASASKGKVKLTWNKPKGQITGFQVQKSKYASKGYSTITKNTTKTGITNTKNLKKGTTYYYKVRPISKVNGTTTYGQWATVKVRAK